MERVGGKEEGRYMVALDAGEGMVVALGAATNLRGDLTSAFGLELSEDAVRPATAKDGASYTTYWSHKSRFNLGVMRAAFWGMARRAYHIRTRGGRGQFLERHIRIDLRE